MKTISLWQPWASAIAAGVKRCETRSWHTPYTGPLAIHAAKRWTQDEGLFFDLRLSETPVARDLFAAAGIHRSTDLPFGVIVATCEIYGCRKTEDVLAAGVLSEMERAWGDYRPGRWVWMLRDVRPLVEPLPWIGRQGFFETNISSST